MLFYGNKIIFSNVYYIMKTIIKLLRLSVAVAHMVFFNVKNVKNTFFMHN